MHSASVTIVVVPRERFSYARRSLESIYRHTSYPFDLIYVDGNSPRRLRDYLRKASAEKGFRLIRTETYLSPNQARNLGLAQVRSKYVVFVDNDVDAEQKWLTKLVSCAEITGAWAVSPVYLEGDPRDQIVHMAGGSADFTDDGTTRTFDEDHLYNDRAYAEVRPALQRGETGFFEFHCVLLDMRVFAQMGPLDEQYLSNHEHMDLSLLIRQAGGRIVLEPDCRVTYVHGLLDRDDLQYASRRWSDEWNEKSTERFVAKWKLQSENAWAKASVEWASRHREHLLRLRRSPYTVLKRIAARNVMTRRLYAKLRNARLSKVLG